MISFSIDAPFSMPLLDFLDAVAARRSHHGIEYGHAVQYVGDRHRIGSPVADAAGKRSELGVQNVEIRMLADLVGRRGNGSSWRLFRARHEAEGLQVWF